MSFEQDWEHFKQGLALDLNNELVAACPVDTGFLKNSIDYSINGDEITFSMAEHGAYIEFGTPPHVIEIKNKKVLSDGKQFFGTKVNHPGTRPQPFIRTTFQTKMPDIMAKNLKRHMKND